MGYDYKTGKYEFDFNSIDFPIKLSENVIRYLYPEYRYGKFHCVEYDHFKSILRGEDKSQLAQRVLCELVEGSRLPPENFDIITDEVSKVEELNDNGYPISPTHPVETHVGQCILGITKFNFEYKLHIYISKFDSFKELKRGKTKVVMEGDDFIVEETYMHKACSIYLPKKQIAEERELIKNEMKLEEDRWSKFRREHKQELIDWLTPSLEACVGHSCDRKRWEITSGFIDYTTVIQIERGFCTDCTARCGFPNLIPDGKEHSDKWYELGIDKLGIKYLSPTSPLNKLVLRELALYRRNKDY